MTYKQIIPIMSSVARDVRMADGDSHLEAMRILRESVVPYVSYSHHVVDQFRAIATLFRTSLRILVERNPPYDEEGIIEALYDLYTRKNHDYGNAWEKELDVFGIVAMHIRMYEKFNRVVTLLSNPDGQQVKDESVSDTICDICNYCVMTAMWMFDHHTAQELGI